LTDNNNKGGSKRFQVDDAFLQSSKFTGLGSALVNIKVTVTPSQEAALKTGESDLLRMGKVKDFMGHLEGVIHKTDLEAINSKRGNTLVELDSVGKMQQILNCLVLHPEGIGFRAVLEALRCDKVKYYGLADKIESAELESRLAEQRVVLVDFYNSLGGTGWDKNTHWLSSNDMSSWHGVTVEDGNVVKIDLDNNRLAGQIPDSIRRLYQLRELHLGRNKIAPLTSALGELLHLEKLHAARCEIGGEIPHSIGRLTSLKELVIPSNDLVGVIPDEIGGCESLVRLELWSNRLAGPLPSTLGRLKHLREMRLWRNRIDGIIPVSLGGCTSLVEINLRSNRLTGHVPDSLGKCVSLVQLHLQSNRLEGELPLSLANCARLFKVVAWGNNFENNNERFAGGLLQALQRQIHLDL